MDQDWKAVEAKLRKLRALSKLMDEAIRIPGTKFKFGLDSIIGLMPVVGDTATALLSAYIIREAARLQVPREILARMVLNTAIDLAAGSVPVVGDLFDAAWKANKKNIDLLEAYLKSQKPVEPYIDV